MNGPRFCTACGDRLSVDQRFCESCGIRVATPASPPRGVGANAPSPAWWSILQHAGALLSMHAWLTLVTLLVFMALTVGFWSGRARTLVAAGVAGTADSRGAPVAPGRPCAQAAVQARSDLRVDDLLQLLRRNDAFIVYGPDEFGELQLRFSSGTPTASLAELARSPDIVRAQAFRACL